MIKQRLVKYLDSIGVSRYKFYKETGLSNGFLDKEGAIGSDKCEIIFSHYPNLNPDWLISGIGDSERKKEVFEQINTVNEPFQEYGIPKIPMLPFEAIAGKGFGVFNDIIVERKYDIYEFRDADFITKVKGNSMYPKYNSGDLLACKVIRERLFFQWNKPHVIYTSSQGVLVKRLKKTAKEEIICCISDNPDYDPFEVPISDIVDLAIVIGVVRLE